jgi:hypothetical protein
VLGGIASSFFTQAAEFNSTPWNLLLDLRMWLEPDVEIQNDFRKARSFHLLEGFGDGGRRTQKDGILCQVLGFHVPEPLDHVDEISIVWRGGFGIGGQRRNGAFL